MRVLLAALAVLLAALPAHAQPTLLDHVAPYGGLHVGYVSLSKPAQDAETLGLTEVQYFRGRFVQDDLPTRGVTFGGTLGVEVVRGVSVFGRPSITAFLNGDPAPGIAGLVSADVGLRLQLRLRDNYLAPYAEVSRTVVELYPDTGSRSVTLGAGVAYMHTLTAGLTLDVRYTPLESASDFQYYDRLFAVTLGIVGFTR